MGDIILHSEEGQILALANPQVANSINDDYDWVVGNDMQIGEYCSAYYACSIISLQHTTLAAQLPLKHTALTTYYPCSILLL